MTDIFPNLSVPCCWDGTADAGNPCLCGPEEKVLRAYQDRLPSLPPMTNEQRKWCLDEIESIEGYDWLEYEGYSDHDLAHSVLRAWTDYCRDKGLL